MKDNLNEMSAKLKSVRDELQKVFVGHPELIDGVMAGLFAEGHVLIEGVPGLGKTLLVRSLGKVIGCDFSRIQFTPDLMPSDITGSHIYDQKEQKFTFHPGPVFTNLLLADEINRSPAKTHSALLEIMQEKKTTIDGNVYRVESPFFVLATQNPVESEGTYNLPEAQLDRFLLKLLIHYPTAQEEYKIYENHAGHGQADPLSLETILSKDTVKQYIQAASEVTVSSALLQYITELVRATRDRIEIHLGCSPRAGLALLSTARVMAIIEGRDYVNPDDVKRVALPCFRHRIILTPEAEVEGTTTDDVVRAILAAVEVPGEHTRA